MHAYRSALLLALLLTSTSTLAAQGPASPADTGRAALALSSSTEQELTPSGSRDALRRVGVEFEFAYTADAFRNVRGGAARGSALLNNLDAVVTVDGARLLGLEGVTLLVYGLGNWGGSVSEQAGDLQGVSNIEAPRAFRLYEAWIQKEFGGGASILLGLFDLNSEFYVTDHAGTLINSSWGIGPEYAMTGAAGPSIFPITSLTARLALPISPRLTLRAAVLDGHPGDPEDPSAPRIHLSREEGALVHGELEFRPGADGSDEDDGTVLRVGVWGYTADFPTITGDPGGAAGASRGAYLGFEAPLRAGEAPVWGFARFGTADDRVNRLSWSYAAGLSWEGPFSARPDDEFALGVVGTVDGRHFQDAQLANAQSLTSGELALEATYRIALGEWGALQPDLQYIVDPGMTSDARDAFALGVRAQLVF